MNWLQRWIVDFVNALATWYYRRKYGASARQLGRPPQEEDGQQGFVILEIDGLAHHYLHQALTQGYMPYLARLLLARRLRLGRWRCGLPSTTPASQAGILYGNNWDIPGFRWYDKATGGSVMCKLPGTVRAIQDRISRGHVGLLRGGSSYTNMFDGDARLALFTLSALGQDHVFENVRGLGFLALFALNIVRLLRVIALSLWTWLVYVVKRLASWVRAKPRDTHFTFLGPLLQIFNNIIFREVATFSVMVDIYRGMPAIYASYTGYDEIAHHFGADSLDAFRALRGIDKQIRQIDRIRQLYVQRKYDLYILSDHGMTPSEPFSWLYGQTLEQFLASHTGQEVYSHEERHESEGLPEARVQFLLDELRELEARPRAALSARVLRATRRRLEDELLVEVLDSEWDLSRRGDTVVSSSGSLAHLYFNVTERQMTLSEVALLYPDLLEALVNHEGIGLVAGREGQDVVLAAKTGTLWAGPAEQRLEGEHPLAGLSRPKWGVEQVRRVVTFPRAGDLVLLGAWDQERVVSFEEQVASHGGLGGPQDWPFIAFPRERDFSPRDIENSEQVYERLAQFYGIKVAEKAA